MNHKLAYNFESHAESIHFGTSVLLPNARDGRIGRPWQKGNFYEPGLLKTIYELGLRGTYVDIGMNVGNHSLYFAKVCNSDRVLAFEPFVEHIRRAEMLLELNDVREKVNIFNVALASQPGEIDLSIRTFSTRAITVRLDDVAPRDVSVVKIDVEGAELDVIRGATDVILTCKPYLFVELWDEQFDEGVDTITSLGYKLGRRFKTPTYEFIPL